MSEAGDGIRARIGCPACGAVVSLSYRTMRSENVADCGCGHRIRTDDGPGTNKVLAVTIEGQDPARTGPAS